MVLIKPLISEKSMGGISQAKYVFIVQRKSSKAIIAKTIEDLYKVKVSQVNIINLKKESKIVRGRYQCKTKASKKAIVTLKKGHKIPGFEEKES